VIIKGQCPACLATAGEHHKPDCHLNTPIGPPRPKGFEEGTRPTQSGRISGKFSHLPDQFWVILRETPHDQQRYDTCGDWYTSPGAGLVIKVSHLKDRREMFLVAIHELIEAFLCECAGVQEADVDKFDKDFESGWLETDSLVGNKLAQPIGYPKEPGDHPDAPYYKQHQIATGIERILAAEVGVSWLEYESHIEELSHGN
jgi:hypothetical protein